MLGERKVFNNWPRVRRLKNGRVRISGRLVTAGRFLLVVRALRLLIGLAAVIMLLSATQGMWYMHVPEGTVWFGFSRDLLVIRHGTASLASRVPTAADAVLYDPGRPIDWHLLAVSLAVLGTRKPIAAVGGWLLTPRARVSFTISSSAITARVGCFRRIRLRRNDPAQPITLRAVDPETWNAKHIMALLCDARVLGELSQPSGIVELNAGLRRERLVFAIRGDQAEAIVSRCNESLRETAGLI